jgi:hypothetical protein
MDGGKFIEEAKEACEIFAIVVGGEVGEEEQFSIGNGWRKIHRRS